jgi:hypothetical protein
MNVENLISRIPPRYWGYWALAIWGSIMLFLLRQDAYGLDEGSAKSLLLVWSVADQIATSVVTFGAPDLRILFFTPAGFLWTGNIFAAKVFTTLSLAFSSWLLYEWQRNRTDDESALLATGLLIISPLSLAQLDALSPGIFLLMAFVLGAWLDKAYRAHPHPFGGWYFAQLFISAFSASLHPAGLAYPLALLWGWHKDPLDKKQQKYFIIGVSIVVLSTLLIRMGWNDLEWLQNPVRNLSSIIMAPSLNGEMTITRWISGTIISAILAAIVIKQYRNLWTDFTGRSLLIGLVLGAMASDEAWSVLALGILLYFGIPWLLRTGQSRSGKFIHQRGAVLLLTIIISTLFMQADKTHYERRQAHALADQDQLIKTLSEEVESIRKATEENREKINSSRIHVASQWPGRTMIACKCDTLPLPPAAKDSQAQLSMLSNISYLLFNPQLPANIMLARNLAVLGGDTAETVDLQPGGVLLHFKNTNIPGGK